MITEAVKEKNLLRFDKFDRDSVNLHPDQKKLNLVLRKFSVPSADLTWRELQTSMLYLRGRSWDEIADTARSYLKEAKTKIGAKTKSQFFDEAYKLGLHTLPIDYILGIKKI
jgi:DNA-binding CsgD family transcriptional regulator